MRRSRRRGLFERRPARLCFSAAHARAISETTQSDVQLLRTESCRTNFGEVLQFEKNFAIGPFTKAMYYCFAFFVVFGRSTLESTISRAVRNGIV